MDTYHFMLTNHFGGFDEDLFLKKSKHQQRTWYTMTPRDEYDDGLTECSPVDYTGNRHHSLNVVNTTQRSAVRRLKAKIKREGDALRHLFDG